ncbi:MAG: PPOX class F420-dependent oxidoreductase [Candidatus Limnocylindria bacterium]
MIELTAAMRAFLQERRFAVLATLRKDGSPLLTVMWFLLDGDEIVFNSKRGRRKDDNLTRDPRVSLIVEDEYRFVRVEGRVRAIADPAVAQADIGRLAVRYEGTESAERRMREVFSRQERISYRLPVRRVYAGGFD